jgi:type IV pilus assembly protein PilM
VVDGFSEAEVEAALRLAYEDLMAQIDIGIRYFSSSEDSKPLDKILLGGGGASAPGLKEFIAEHSGIETDTVNPFRLVPCDSKVFGEGGLSVALSNIYAPALGLAMRKF